MFLTPSKKFLQQAIASIKTAAPLTKAEGFSLPHEESPIRNVLV